MRLSRSGTSRKRWISDTCSYNILMSSHPDVLIVGGGVIGLTTALFLAREGCRGAIVDRSDLGMEASWAGAGIIPPGNPAKAISAYDWLRASSSRDFAAFSRELADFTGIDNGYRVCGGIEYLSDDAAELLAAWRAEEVPFELIQPAGYHSERAAYLLPSMAQVRNPWHIRALVAACEHHGVSMRAHTPVDEIERNGNAITGVRLASGERLVAGRYLVAAGAWSEQLLSPFGIRTGIHPVRGQIVLLKTETRQFCRILLAGKNYLVPREDGHILIGSTEEPEAGFVKANTTEAVEELVDFAASLAPALQGAAIVKTWSGLRPGSLDGLPSLGRVGDLANLYLAAGHFRAGIQLSPATGRVMADLLLDRSSPIALDDFRPGREPGRPVRVVFHS